MTLEIVDGKIRLKSKNVCCQNMLDVRTFSHIGESGNGHKNAALEDYSVVVNGP